MARSDGSPCEIRLSGPDITEEEVEAVSAVLRSGRISLGPRLPEFERMVAHYAGCQHGVAVNSGTSALHLIVRALEIGEGDEVITTPFSFVASSNCLLFERAAPRFVDIDGRTLNINCDLIEAAITSRTKAILAVDVFGWPADWERLREIAGKYSLALIEDSCEALGARYRLRDGGWARAGSLGDVGTFAFYPNKQITSGEGGIVVTNDEKIAKLCRSMRNQGRDDGTDWGRPSRLGYNYRLSELHCALGIVQMKRIEEILARRNQVAAWYQEALSEIEGVQPPRGTEEVEISWFVYAVRLTACRSRAELRRVIQGLRERGIACSNYFYPIHLLPLYREKFGYKRGDFPVAEAASRQSLALPFFNRLTREEVEQVARCLRESLSEVDRHSAHSRRVAATGQ